jgi:hypothetical protein
VEERHLGHNYSKSESTTKTTRRLKERHLGQNADRVEVGEGLAKADH